MADRKYSRRRWLRAAAGATSLAALAGCLGGDGDDPLQQTSTATPTDTSTATPTDRHTATPTEERTTESQTPTAAGMEPLELLHAWSAGDGRDAMAALVEGFREAHPDVEFETEPVGAGARPNLREVVQNRLAQGPPPSTWQAWPGANLRQYEEDLGDVGATVWNATDMADAYADGPKRAARLDGTFVAVPLDVHRVNNLFYNRAVLDDAGVDPSAIHSPADLADVLATVATETDAVPLAHQTRAPWSTGQLWETVLLGQTGPGGYRALLSGTLDRAALRQSLETLRDYAEYYPENAASISWPEANTLLVEGEAAFIHQGDWAAAPFEAEDGFAYGEDWGQVPFPGTAGTYLQVLDSFTYPAANPSPAATRTFLRYCGTADAQARFNGPKGSVPPRTDVDVSGFSAFQRDQYDDYRSASDYLPSVQHGLAVPPVAHSEAVSAIDEFLASGDVEATTDALLAVFEEQG